MAAKAKAARVCGHCAGAPRSREHEAAHTRCAAIEGHNRCECAAAGHAPTELVRDAQARHTGLTVEECVAADPGLTPEQATACVALRELENGERAAAFTKVYVGALPIRELRRQLVSRCGMTEQAAAKVARRSAQQRIVKAVLTHKEHTMATQAKNATAKAARRSSTKATTVEDDGTGLPQARGNGMPNVELLAWITKHAPQAASVGGLFKAFRAAGNSANAKRFARAVAEAGVTFDAAPKAAPAKAAAKKVATKAAAKPKAKATAKRAPAKKAPAKKATAKKATAKRTTKAAAK